MPTCPHPSPKTNLPSSSEVVNVRRSPAKPTFASSLAVSLTVSAPQVYFATSGGRVWRRSMFAGKARVLLVPILGALLVAVWSSPGRAVTPAASTEGVPAFGHVFTIIGENTEQGQVNRTNSPYLIGTLKPRAAWLSNYFAVTHFSEANYAAMTSGQFTHCQQFDGSIATCHQDVENVFHQLDTAGVSWKSWMESMPTPCQVTSAGGAKTLNHYA